MIDLRRLRVERLARLQGSMRERGVAACLLTHPANVRYATGTAVMTVYGLGYFFRCALVPADGQPVLFEHPNSIHLTKGLLAEVRPMMWDWEFAGSGAKALALRWAEEIRDALKEKGLEGEALALDRLTTPGFMALQDKGIALTDAGPAILDARKVKTAQEIEAFRSSAPIVMSMLSAMETSIVPGASERDLLAVMTETLIRGGGEYQITRGVASGPNTNPWRVEASDRAIEEGDLVFVDTDCHAIEGYFFCVSRTFLCGVAGPTREQKDAYRAAYEFVRGASELLRPGTSFSDIGPNSPRLPDRYVAQRYEVLGHSVGLEDEGPYIPYPDEEPPEEDRVIEENMVIVLECYCGEVGRRNGVKLGDQFIVTPAGAESLVPYSYEARLAPRDGDSC